MYFYTGYMYVQCFTGNVVVSTVKKDLLMEVFTRGDGLTTTGGFAIFHFSFLRVQKSFCFKLMLAVKSQ